MDGKIGDTKDELEEEIRNKFDKVLGSENRIIKKVEDLETEKIISKSASRCYQGKSDNYEKRIGVMKKTKYCWRGGIT